MAKIVPELNYLLAEVEKRYGRRLSTSADFEALSVVVEHESGELISASTLKRLWGYVTLKPTPESQPSTCCQGTSANGTSTHSSKA